MKSFSSLFVQSLINKAAKLKWSCVREEICRLTVLSFFNALKAAGKPMEIQKVETLVFGKTSPLQQEKLAQSILDIDLDQLRDAEELYSLEFYETLRDKINNECNGDAKLLQKIDRIWLNPGRRLFSILLPLAKRLLRVKFLVEDRPEHRP